LLMEAQDLLQPMSFSPSFSYCSVRFFSVPPFLCIIYTDAKLKLSDSSIKPTLARSGVLF
jgi:hypothetical protein